MSNLQELSVICCIAIDIPPFELFIHFLCSNNLTQYIFVGKLHILTLNLPAASVHPISIWHCARQGSLQYISICNNLLIHQNTSNWHHGYILWGTRHTPTTNVTDRLLKHNPPLKLRISNLNINADFLCPHNAYTQLKEWSVSL